MLFRSGCGGSDHSTGIVRDVPVGRCDRRPDSNRAGVGACGIPLGVLSQQRHQRTVGGNWRHHHSETNPARPRTRYRSRRGHVVHATGSRKHVVGDHLDAGRPASRCSGDRFAFDCIAGLLGEVSVVEEVGHPRAAAGGAAGDRTVPVVSGGRWRVGDS